MGGVQPTSHARACSLPLKLTPPIRLSKAAAFPASCLSSVSGGLPSHPHAPDPGISKKLATK
jgi:hypothetical protein